MKQLRISLKWQIELNQEIIYIYSAFAKLYSSTSANNSILAAV